MFPPEYEGTFTLISSRGSGGSGGSVVESEKDTPDPKGEGRTRNVEVKSVSGSIITGSVEWREDGVLSKKDVAEWDELINVMKEAENEGAEEEEERNLVGGWKAVEEIAADSFDDLPAEAIKSLEEMDQQRERHSTISLVTSSAKNLLFFA